MFKGCLSKIVFLCILSYLYISIILSTPNNQEGLVERRHKDLEECITKSRDITSKSKFLPNTFLLRHPLNAVKQILSNIDINFGSMGPCLFSYVSQPLKLIFFYHFIFDKHPESARNHQTSQNFLIYSIYTGRLGQRSNIFKVQIFIGFPQDIQQFYVITFSKESLDRFSI